MRAIELLRDRFVHALAICEADTSMPDETVHCGEYAVMMVRVDGREAFVCHHHLTLLCREKWPHGEPDESRKR